MLKLKKSLLPKISVITATWQRHKELLRAIESVSDQTFADFEHIIVSDGPDPKLEGLLQNQNCKYVALGRNWRSFSGGLSPGASPRLVGTYIAAGEYIAYLDDDNVWLPDHLKTLLDALRSEKADWVYSKMQVLGPTGIKESVIGDGLPRQAMVDTNMLIHKTELIKNVNWKTDFYEDDWQLVETWMKQGRKFAWVNEITVNYYRRERE